MTEEGSIPPVAPEVINIFLLQRNEMGTNAPSEHITFGRFSAWVMFLYSIFSSSFRAKWMSRDLSSY